MEGDPTISAKSKTSLDILNNEIVEAEYESHHILPIVLDGDSKIEHGNKWRTYRKRIEILDKQRVQVLEQVIS